MGKSREPSIPHNKRPFYMKTAKRDTSTRYSALEKELDRLVPCAPAANLPSTSEVQQTLEGNDFSSLTENVSSPQTLNDGQLSESLSIVFAEYGVQRACRDVILCLLRKHGHPHLPLSSKTLMGTRREPVRDLIQIVSGGRMYYAGIEAGLNKTVTFEYLAKCKDISVEIFWDGLSPYESVKTKVWPILCRLSRTEFSNASHPFIVAIFEGRSDPLPDVLLKDFIQEAKRLENNGIILNGVRYEFVIKRFIADFPARARMKCVCGEGSSSFVQCERCTIVGKRRQNTTCFTPSDAKNATLRTDHTFRNRLQMEYHCKKKGLRLYPNPDSPLLQLSVDMVYDFPLDSMHVLYQGVVKRWWEFIVEQKKSNNHQHITEGHAKKISKYMEANFRDSFPTEYARRVRGVGEYCKWKATEWRRFLLYDGLLIAKMFLNDATYRSFLLLSCAARILSSPELITKDGFLSDAHNLLVLFVKDAEFKFEKKFISIKVHGLTHLAKDCEKQGVLDSFSAFPFESYLSRINKAMTAHGRCLEQIIGRILEGKQLQPAPVTMRKSASSAILSKEIDRIEWQGNTGIEYQEALLPNMLIRTDRPRDSICKTKEGDIIKVISIIREVDSEFVLGRMYKHHDSFFTWPLDSRTIGIEKVWGLDAVVKKWPLKSLKCKCVLLKNDSDPDTFLCLPLIHGEGE